MLSITPLFELKFSSTPEIIVYSEFTGSRLFYTLDFIIKRVWQKNYVLTHDIEAFKNSDKIKINYSEQFIENTINLYPLSLLKNKGIDKSYHPHFKINDSNYYPEDIFAKVFYFISRYEEWQKNYIKDFHGRFELRASIFKDQLHKAIVDESITEFKNFIRKLYPSFNPDIIYKEILTFDLDNILAFQGKGLIRSIGAVFKHVLKAEYLLLLERMKVLLNKKDDPFVEVYDFIETLKASYPVIFFVLCRSNTKYDRAANINYLQTKSILNYLKHFAHIGLHPSYYTMNDTLLIQREKKVLEEALQEKVISSRQHYLRMDISVTPKLLVQLGIQYDFTMGFASDTGFRAGTSYPVYYYNFDKEQAENLLFIPFCIMDGAYFNYQNIPIEESIKHIQTIQRDIQKTGGYFIPLFHEITLCSLFNPFAYRWRKALEKY